MSSESFLTKFAPNITKSAVLGNTHPDTFFCNDFERLTRLHSDLQDAPRITQIDIYTDGGEIYGFEVHYSDNREVGHHLGSMLTPAVKEISIKFDEDEYVTIDPDRAQMLAEKQKARGNAFLKEQKYVEAVTSYTLAINLDDQNHIYYR